MKEETQDPLAGLPKPTSGVRRSPLDTKADGAGDGERWWLQDSIKPDQANTEMEESASASMSNETELLPDNVEHQENQDESIDAPNTLQAHAPTEPSRSNGNTTGLYVLIGIAMTAIVILFLKA